MLTDFPEFTLVRLVGGRSVIHDNHRQQRVIDHHDAQRPRRIWNDTLNRLMLCMSYCGPVSQKGSFRSISLIQSGGKIET